jgi:putative cell wall-binding protein
LRRLIIPLLAISLAVATVALPPRPLRAQATAGPHRVVPVAPGVDRFEYAFTKPSGAPVVAQVVAVTPTPGIRIGTVLGHDRVPGLETTLSKAQRLVPSGGVAAVNGGFWLNAPVGDPNSYFASAGRLVSESETQGSQSRGTFAVNTAGFSVIDRIDAQVHLQPVLGDDVAVTGVNRRNRTQPEMYADGPDALYAYTEEYGPLVTLPGPEASDYRGPAHVAVVSGMELAAAGPGAPGVVLDVVTQDGGEVAIEPGSVVLVGYGRAEEDLAALRGQVVTPKTAIRFPERSRPDEWESVAEGVAAGPLIVRDGVITERASWEHEGFVDQTHSAPSAPRTAVGVRADDTTLLVTVDGRQPGHSVGMTMTELAQFMIDLGAVDALALDGGGSTQLAIDGVLRNRPCQSSSSCGAVRPVASSIVVFHDYDYAATERLSGSGREETAVAVAHAAYPEGATDAVLAFSGNFPDALAGGPLAAARSAPLLLTGRDALSAATREALRELGTRRVTILGGTSAIGPEVAAELGALGYRVERLAGSGRVETATTIAGVTGPRHQLVFVASAGGFADALSAAAPAGLLGAPILLTGSAALTPATRDAIAAMGATEIVLVGGTGVISDRVERDLRGIDRSISVTRLAGVDRFATARTINEWAASRAELDPSGLVVARGDTFPDALAGGPLAAARNQLLMILPRDDVRAQGDVAAYLDQRAEGDLSTITLLGGRGVLSSYQQWQLDQLAQ